MQIDREPMPGTNMDIVLGLLKQGLPRWEVATTTQFSREKVAYTICNLRRLGYYSQTPEVRYNEWREAVSRGRGGIFLSVQEYAELGMSPREIREAIILRQQKEFSPVQVCNAVTKARIRGDLKYLTDEEKRSIRRDSHLTREQIGRRVSLWLDVKDAVDASCVLPAPANRIDWLLLSRFLGERRARFDGYQLDGIFHEDTEISFIDIDPNLSTHIPTLRDISKQQNPINSDVIIRNLALPGEFKEGEAK